MQKLEYEVRFVTPTFLGNADQNGQWRTPPFKALLRQWWRVAYAAQHGFKVDIGQLRCEEGFLFGHAWLENDRDEEGSKVTARKSRVRLRLDRWSDGQETKSKWGSQELQPNWKVAHPEVNQPVGPLLYLGYGPLRQTDRQPYATVLKGNAAIQAGESAKLSIAVPGAAVMNCW
jgi:CRISPR-associated protein Cmr1